MKNNRKNRKLREIRYINKLLKDIRTIPCYRMYYYEKISMALSLNDQTAICLELLKTGKPYLPFKKAYERVKFIYIDHLLGSDADDIVQNLMTFRISYTAEIIRK